ncbi:MAG: Rrf2 family transcriptional regulator [Sulfuricurvum sp.]|uniref:RrF2 family transcriptional regulator n=1 Tax=Sulfuricurvum sp. TaxID=2025608 RepID=UPI00260645DD|nr:Rrf2 family transcriptional regulator [Sulfuricurvum sp.]MDD4885037.1 Rrf2 family transcriptional regulator [Sulfuricurvum sp.]
MAGISTKGSYGLAAMYELALHYGQGHLQIRDIADKANIPSNYLEQILSTLRKEGMIQSIRGAGGGYLLAKAPNQIQVYMILFALEGELCLPADEGVQPVLHLYWERVKEEMRTVFHETLQDLVDKGNELNQQTMYFI